MPHNGEIFFGKGKEARTISLSRFNRHGLIAGATGTGKTVTLRVLAEGLSNQGVPIFLADVKGDLAGLSTPGEKTEKISQRLAAIDQDSFSPRGSPVQFWDLFQQKGHPVRTTISEMGPILLSRLLNLNETQSGVLQIAFRVADDQKLLLLDIPDLKALLQLIAEKAKELTVTYGNVSAASVGAIQRAILTMEEQGATQFFGEPALNISDFFQTDESGRGYINILSAEQLIQSPKLYGTFLLWFLSELYEQLPEVGDIPKPKLVFFFDEAHLLFEEIHNALLEKIEQIVRLIRSKGVGVFFITQNPTDIPDKVLSQLGSRFQHALRAFTPKDKKAITSLSQTFRASDGLDVEKVILELGIGEALVSVLDDQGVPSPVERVLISVPESRLGAINESERQAVLAKSLVKGVYERTIDRESAHEVLKARHQMESTEEEMNRSDKSRSKRATPLEAFISSTARSIGSQVGRQIVRGILGAILGKK